MDAVESAAVMESLRKRIITYLHHIIPLLQIREQSFLPVPFPDDPTRLPIDFPHSDCFHTFTVQWNDAEHQVQHNFEVKLVHFSPEPGEQHVTWELVFKRQYSLQTRVQIGLLLVDKELCEDQSFFPITGPLVLTLLGVAIVSADPVRVRKITLASTNTPHTVLEVVQMECRNRSSELARQEL